jgi:molybdate transport system substrate-binding protein
VRAIILVALCVVCLIASPPAGAGQVGRLTVFAAASLTEAFTLLGRVLTQRNPGLLVVTNFAGSQQLASQITMGAPADVFASADQRWMDDVRGRGLLAGPPVEFVRNASVALLSFRPVVPAAGRHRPGPSGRP